MTLRELFFTFEGRVPRRAFWFAAAIFLAAQIVAGMIDWIASGTRQGLLSMVVSLLVLVASIAVSVSAGTTVTSRAGGI